MNRIVALILGLVVAAAAGPVFSASEVTQDLEIILDASGSMRGRIGSQTKMEIAEQTLLKLADQISSRSDLALALRIYGHQYPTKEKNCRDSRLEIPFGRVDPSRIRSLLKRIKPQGYTPLAFSLGEAGRDFDLKTPRVRSVVIITDGLETCGGDPCRLARELAEAGLDITLHVVGFDLKKEEMAKLKCLTEPSGGMLLEARNAEELIKALNEVMKKVLVDNLAVKVTSSAQKPRNAHVEVFKAGTKERVTIHQGKSTRFTLPAGRYDLVVRDFLTRQTTKLANLEVTKDKTLEKTVVFDSGRLVADFRTNGGEPLKGYVEIWRLEGGREVDHRGSYVTGRPQVFNVASGLYRLAARLNKLGPKQVIDPIRVEPDQEVVEKIVFGQARLKIVARDASGMILPALVEIRRLENGRPAGSNTEPNRSQPLVFDLEPGEYRVKVHRQTPKSTITLEGISLKDGQELTREAVF